MKKIILLGAIVFGYAQASWGDFFNDTFDSLTKFGEKGVRKIAKGAGDGYDAIMKKVLPSFQRDGCGEGVYKIGYTNNKGHTVIVDENEIGFYGANGGSAGQCNVNSDLQNTKIQEGKNLMDSLGLTEEEKNSAKYQLFYNGEKTSEINLF